MIHKLEKMMLKRIQAGLDDNKDLPCSRWSEKYRVMGEPFPGPWTHDHHPWLLEIEDCDYEKIVAQKAAQTGFTEVAINVAFYNIMRGQSVLYLLPTAGDASEFSAGRFDPALENSEYLRTLFKNVNNVKMKSAGKALLYIRGANVRAGKSRLKSIPTPVVILDEMDEMSEVAVALVEERQSGQIDALLFALSTPTIEDVGVNKLYKVSTQDVYVFRCPGCSRYIEFEYPRNFVLIGDSVTDPRIAESHYICHLCQKRLQHEDKINFLKHKLRGGSAHYVSTHSDRAVKGYTLNQMYSMSRSGRPDLFGTAAMGAKFDPIVAQEFSNSKLALPYRAQGAKITDEMFAEVQRGSPPKRKLIYDKIRTIGVDVGSKLHLVCKEWDIGEENGTTKINDVSIPTIVEQTTLDHFDEILEVYRELRASYLVVDGDPERREALRLVDKLQGVSAACDYIFHQQGRSIMRDPLDGVLRVNRTYWMDQALYRYKKEQIRVALDVDEEFKKHLKEPVRIVRRDKWGNTYGIYVNAGPDHYAHASVYAEIAFSLVTGSVEVQDIEVE